MRKLMVVAGLILTLACGGDKEKQKPTNQMVEINATDIKEKEVVCFVYHRFGDSRYSSTNIAVEDFESQLNWLQKQNYQVLTLIDAIDYIQSDKPFQKTAVITIDDGYKSFYKSGLPLLTKYKMPATLFVNTETVGAGDYMSWQELKNANDNGIEIGNHSHSHAYFLNEKQDTRYHTFLNEIKQSQKLFSQYLNTTPIAFAFPYGEFDEEMITVVKANGFKYAVVQNSGIINTKTDLFQLPRFPMSEAYSKMFEEKANMKSLQVIRKTPTTPILPKGRFKPIVTLTINTRGLKTDQMQCFVQGSNCKINTLEKKETEMTVTLQSSTSIASRRRTLYTITIPDEDGNWHWFSHLWINPSVK